MSSWHRVIGIDLGTTYSVVAAYNHDRQDVRVIPNRQNEPTTPSVVYVSSTGQMSVGRPAKEKLARDPAGVIIEAKRMMGDTSHGTKVMVKLGDREVDPELISATILKELKSYAEKMIGAPVHDAVITVPAYFTEAQKNATREAAKIARLNPRLLMNEPTAAAVAYGLESGERQTFVVYDIGGGTFDVSVVRIEDESTVAVLGTGGNARLGGGDIDQRIVDWALGKMKTDHGRDFSGEAKLVGKLRVRAEQTKIVLCNEGGPQDFVVEAPVPGIDEVAYSLSQAEFEEMCRPLLERTMREVDVALESARSQHDLALDDIEAFILVGGSSKIPMVAKMLKEKYRKPIKADLNPDEIVAMGAARMGLNYEPSLAAEVRDNAELKIDRSAPSTAGLSSTNIKDVVSHTLGVGLHEDVYDPLIPKDHIIPHRVARGGYTTAKDNQTTICVPVYQGDNSKASLNTKLGEVVIDGLTPEPKGSHQFQITFALDADGIFAGEILHVQKGTKKEIKLERGNEGLTEKKRLNLAQMLDAGTLGVPPSGGTTPATGGGATTSDPVDALAARAQEVLSALPLDKQRDIVEALTALSTARASGNSDKVATAVARLTVLLMQHSH
jgi:molecular chaperone DnaK